MNNTKRAIKLAVEGGYDEETFSVSHLNLRVANTEAGSIDMPLDCIFLDKNFWVALGKSLGWSHITAWNYESGHKIVDDKWWLEWHRFIDYLASDKDAESYFKELLKDRKSVV